MGGASGFFSSSSGPVIFSALADYLGHKEIDFKMSEKKWKMSFNVAAPMDEAEEGEEPILEKAVIECRLEVSKGALNAPEELHVSFLRKSGSNPLFMSTVKDLIDTKLMMFSERQEVVKQAPANFSTEGW